jgi:GDP-L-fucose synthase
VSRLHNLGWKHRVELRAGIEAAYEWFRSNRANAELLPLRAGATL